MGFADAYLHKHAIRGPLVLEIPDPQLNTIIAIPAFNESGLTTCLDSLFQCDPPVAPAEVIVLLNSSESSSREIVTANRRSYEEVREWIRQHRTPRYRAERSEAASQQVENFQSSGQQENTNRDPAASQPQENFQSSDPQENRNQGQDSAKPQEKVRFHVVLVEDLPDKHFGAGLARKLVMDEAVRRLADRASGNQMEKGSAGDRSVGQKVEEEPGSPRGAAPGQSAEEQVRRAAKEKVSGIIVSLDADTVVRRDYLRAVEDHFSRHPQTSGCAISFEHPLSQQEYSQLFSRPVSQSPNTSDTSSPPHSRSENLSPGNQPKENLPRESQPSPTPENLPPSNLSPASQPNENPTPESLSLKNRNLQNPPPEVFPPEVFDAVTNYELHQRYYLLAVRYTGYPYAFHTVGSCFAVQVEAYCRAGGMSRRKAGEDFYFIQKLAMQGRFTECRSTRVYPSPRPSDRVPFGTGPDISRQINGGGSDASVKHPDDRDNDGTGQDIRQSGSGTGSDASVKQLPPYLTYHPELFEHLRRFFALTPHLYRSDHPAAGPEGSPGTLADADSMSVNESGSEETPKNDPSMAAEVDPHVGKKREAPENDPTAATDNVPPIGTNREAPENDPPAAADGDPPVEKKNAAVLEGVPPVFGRYLEESGFWGELEEIRANTASEGAFRKRFFNKFNMFWILKYLHYAEKNGVEKVGVENHETEKHGEKHETEKHEAENHEAEKHEAENHGEKEHGEKEYGEKEMEVKKMEVTEAAGVMLEMWENAHGRSAPSGKGPEEGKGPEGEKDPEVERDLEAGNGPEGEKDPEEEKGAEGEKETEGGKPKKRVQKSVSISDEAYDTVSEANFEAGNMRGPVSGRGSSNNENGNLTREMLLLYRKYFG